MAPFRQSCSRFAKVSGSSWVSWFAEVVVMTSDPVMKRFMILHLLFDKVQRPGNCLTDRRRPHCDTCTRFAWQSCVRCSAGERPTIKRPCCLLKGGVGLASL